MQLYLWVFLKRGKFEMIYVMSDLHGCFDKYLLMLEKIKLSEKDTLYILGDVVDRGADGVRILLDIAKRKNVVMLRGNHDDTALIILKNLFAKESKLNDQAMADMIRLWRLDGGEQTLKQFLACSSEDRKSAMMVLSYSLIYEELDINGKHYFLSHTIPGKDALDKFNECKMEDFLWGEPEYEREYYPNKVFVTGHTPTGLIDPEFKGRIYKKNNHIAVDCGAVFGFPLACIRLDDMKEFYV